MRANGRMLRVLPLRIRDFLACRAPIQLAAHTGKREEETWSGAAVREGVMSAAPAQLTVSVRRAGRDM